MTYSELKELAPSKLVKILTNNNFNVSSALRELQIHSGDPRARKYLLSIFTHKMLRSRKKESKRTYTLTDVKLAVKNALCVSDVLRNLKLTTHGSNAKTILKLIETNKIDISHFNKTLAMTRNKHRWTKEQIFVENSPIPRATVNVQVRKHNVLGKEICSECDICEFYNNKPIRLTVDHKNGIVNDNRVENLRWLCHNCHSQTTTYCGKKKKN